jgi:hypothetical protein
MDNRPQFTQKFQITFRAGMHGEITNEPEFCFGQRNNNVRWLKPNGKGYRVNYQQRNILFVSIARFLAKA